MNVLIAQVGTGAAAILRDSLSHARREMLFAALTPTAQQTSGNVIPGIPCICLLPKKRLVTLKV
jgi:hypothetical protein